MEALKSNQPQNMDWIHLFRRELRDDEAISLSSLDRVFGGFYKDDDRLDSLIWSPSTDGNFTVASTYSALLPPSVAHVGGCAWQLPAPPKVQLFIWSALHGKILTRDVLARRGKLKDSEVARLAWAVIASSYTYHPPSTPTTWIPPPVGVINVNFDGSSLGNPGPAGYGGSSGIRRETYSYSTSVEMHSVLHALRHFQNRFSGTLVVEGDSSNVIGWCKQTQFPRGASTFVHEWHCISRSANSLADSLAKQGTQLLARISFPDPQWRTIDAVGSAGGVLVIWNRNNVEVLEDEHGAHCLGLKLRDIATSKVWCIGGIYGPCSNSGRKEFWEELENLLHCWDDPWIIAGDFNVIRYRWEKSPPAARITSQMRSFNDLIDAFSLKEVPTAGKRFTWCNNQMNPILSKLDRILASPEWLRLYLDCTTKVLNKVVSDHWPILLDTKAAAWGKKPFRTLQPRREMQTLHCGTSFPQVRGGGKALARGPLLSGGNRKSGAADCTRQSSRTGWLQRRILLSLLGDFHENGIKHKSLGSSLIALAQKKDSVEDVRGYRPISQISGLYKIIARVLAARLKSVSPSVISLQQNAFVQNRQLMDSAMFIHEVVHWFKQKAKPTLILKIDLEKAFNRVNWRYLDCSRGIRHGDPLSPLLFNIAAEGIIAFFEQLIRIGWLCSPLPNEELPIVLFADDTVIFCEGDLEQVANLKAALRLLQITSRQKINWSKTKVIGVNASPELLQAATTKLECEVGDFLTVHLGLPLFNGRINQRLWDPVIERLRGRLSAWKGRHLSEAGRLVLLKPCLFGIPTFLLSFLHCPASAALEMEAIVRRFLWRGACEDFKFHLIRWTEVCKPVTEGGLGVWNIRDFNRALFLKWCWRLNEGDRSPWTQLVRLKLQAAEEDWILGHHQPRRLSPIWRRLCKLMLHFVQNTKFIAGNGSRINFWENQPRRSINWSRVFKRELRDQEAIDLVELDNEISSTFLDSQYADRLIWTPSVDGTFTVKSAYRVLTNNVAAETNQGSLAWSFEGPPKAKFFLWTTIRRKILTRDNLIRRGMTLQSTDCPLCHSAPESIDHALLHCAFAWRIWMTFLQLFEVKLCVPSTTHDMVLQWRGIVKGAKGKIMAEVAAILIPWCIWEERNRRVFQNNTQTWSMVAKNTITKVIAWLCTRKEFADTSGNVIRQKWKETADLSILGRPKELRQWVPPLRGILKLNTDGSSLGNPGRAGIGGIFRDHNGNTLLTYSGPIGITDSTEAEVRAILGVKIYSATFLEPIEVEGDSQNVVDWCYQDRNPPWRFLLHMREIWELSTNVIRWKRIPRSANHCVDQLAKGVSLLNLNVRS
ncbi:hypothetical protein H6P81_012774 [Aristolochia fimbriata]|uniref:Reverse transcriptase domain-containing protein n=1 Tax=Aristolochia fimbriata TaxID=158543 RepID=A0AAV7EE18_ARIFI|nr:hypothetical protein H6P81_012774 [Aristolochia fimbriata]